ncbi:MAG: hypothetical protein ACTSQP_22915 [Promethearchaeota archaeon]
MLNFIIEFFIITIVGGTIVGLILLIINRINFRTIFFKTRIRRVLKKYIKIRHDPKKEKKIVRKFGQLLDNGKSKLIKNGFKFINQDDTIQNDLFKLHVTRIGSSGIIDRFLISRLKDNGVYYSESYPEFQKEKNDTKILLNFIENL